MKTTYILLLFVISSCAYDPPEVRSKVRKNDVEIFCYDIGRRILVETSNSNEVKRSIQKFIEQKRSQGTSEDYSVLRFDDKSSLYIKGIPPEKLITCSIRDVKPVIIDTYYKY